MKPKIVALTIPKDKLDYLEKIIATAKYVSDKTKHNLIKRIAEYSPCCSCSGIPKFQVIYEEGGAQRLEYYCGKGCLEALSKRKAEEPTGDKDELAEYYGCTNGSIYSQVERILGKLKDSSLKR